MARSAATIPGGSPSPWSPQDAAQAPPLARFDAGWYRTIALQGYATPEAARFYPLYPFLAGSLSRFSQVPVFEAATGLSVVFVIAAAALAAARSRPRYGDGNGAEGGLAGVAALFFFPTAFFFAAPTSDALFVFCVAAALAAADKQRWTWAAAAGIAAALTRAPGFLLGLAFALHRGDRPRPRWAAAALVTLAGTVFPVFVARRFGDATLAWRAPEGSDAPVWRLPFDLLREAAQRLREPGAGGKLVFALGLGSLILFAILAAAAWRRGDRAGAIFSLAALLLLAGRGSLHGMHREVLALLPCSAVLGRALVRSIPAAFAYALAGAGLGAVLLVRYVLWIPVE